MQKHQLDSKIKKLWYLGHSLLFLLLAAPFIIIQGIIGFILPLTIVGIILCALIGGLLYWLPSLKYDAYKFGYNETRIQINYGVIFKHEIVIPVCQIQDLHLSQGPLMQLLKLQTVEISTAGSNYRISGLENNFAKEFIDTLENYLKNRIEVLNNEEI